MPYSKVIFEDSELEDEKEKPYSKMKCVAVALMKAEILKGFIIGGFKAKKIKGLIKDGIKGENLRSRSYSIKGENITSGSYSKLKLWILGLAYLVLLWTVALQFIGLRHKFTPSLIKTRNAYSLPPESMYQIS